jgi:KAP family P-loop domain
MNAPSSNRRLNKQTSLQQQQEEEEEELTIDRFSSGSRRALGWANTLRRMLKEGHVHIEHLIAGLYQSKDDRVLDAFRTAKIEWPMLLQILHEGNPKIPNAPENIRIESGEATTLPPLSGNAKPAVEQIAVFQAQSENSDLVLPHHLLFGALSIGIPVIRELKKRGLRRELLRENRPTERQVDKGVQQEVPADENPETLPANIKFNSEASHRVLAWADAFRKTLEQHHVHHEHFIAALYQSHDKRVRDAFDKAGISWPQLLSVLHQSEPKIPINPDEIRVEPGKATAPLSVLSRGAEAGLLRGVNLAREEKSDAVLPHHFLFGVLSVNVPAAHALRKLGLLREWLQRAQDIAGVSSDVAKGDDLLHIEKEVEALCSVIAARDVKPPLSIGLFGDWGTGKSFFMEKMGECILRLEEQGAAENSPFCAHIVQLKFNAWHYIDTNLWATLGSEIFRELADALAKDPKQPAQARERLLAATASQRDVLAEAERRASAASEQLHQNEERLIQLASDEAEIDATLSKPSVILRAAYRVAVQDPAVQVKVREAAQALNIPSVDAAATETKAQLMELHGLAGVAWGMWLAARRHKRIAVLSVLAGLLILAIPYFLAANVAWAKEMQLDSAIARVGALLTAVAAALGPFAKKVSHALKLIGEARKQSLATVNDEKRKKEEELGLQKKKIQEEAVGLQKRVDEESVALAKLEQQLEELRADRQMSNFIISRNESRDYTAHLGVIARARDDFQRLSDLLGKVQEQIEAEKKGEAAEEKLLLPRIDRIILYIDDLDRCPEDKVVDVLQAVHLLLAFPLFVVVVGVDSRWLLHSLKQHSRAFQAERNGDESELDEEGLHWQSTPLNYLEKIFQIPFSLRPMQPTGFADLVEKLTEPKKPPPEKKIPESAVPGEPTGKPQQKDPSKPSGVTPTQEPQPPSNLPPGPTPGPTVSAASLLPQDGGQTEKPSDKKTTVFQPLDLREEERNFMKLLHPLIPTPRAAKRFVNVYRLFRALNEEDEAFRGSKERAQHRAVLVLLAILTGHPTQGTEFLRDLLDGKAKNRSWWKFVDGYRSRAEPKPGGAASQAEAEPWRQFFEKIDDVQKDLSSEINQREMGCQDFNESCDAFVKWAGQVSRFSFQSARVVLQRTSEEIPAPKQPVTPAV